MFADMFYYNELNKCVIDLFVICYIFQLSNKDKIMLILIIRLMDFLYISCIKSHHCMSQG